MQISFDAGTMLEFDVTAAPAGIPDGLVILTEKGCTTKIQVAAKWITSSTGQVHVSESQRVRLLESINTSLDLESSRYIAVGLKC